MVVTYEVNLINLIEQFNSEDKCRDYLEALRWPDGIICPRCKCKSISKIETRQQYECNACQYQFSATSGTIMHDTHLPLWKWFLAVYMIVELKGGRAANQLSCMIEVSYKNVVVSLPPDSRALLQTPRRCFPALSRLMKPTSAPRSEGRARGIGKATRWPLWCSPAWWSDCY